MRTHYNFFSNLSFLSHTTLHPTSINRNMRTPYNLNSLTKVANTNWFSPNTSTYLVPVTIKIRNTRRTTYKGRYTATSKEKTAASVTTSHPQPIPIKRQRRKHYILNSHSLPNLQKVDVRSKDDRSRDEVRSRDDRFQKWDRCKDSKSYKLTPPLISLLQYPRVPKYKVPTHRYLAVAFRNKRASQ
jgi:hypothetical protein